VSAIASLLVPGEYVLAPEVLLTPGGPIKDGILAVSACEIRFAGRKSDFEKDTPGVAATELPGKATIPGMIDAHVHLGQGFGKALVAGEPAQIWRRIWGGLEQSLNPDTVYLSAKWMLLEALRGGFTGVVNFAIYDEARMDAINRAGAELGIRLVSAAGTVEPVDLPTLAKGADRTRMIDRAISRGEYLINACKARPTITPSLCLSGVQGASGELIRVVSEFCANNGVLFQIHTNEHHVEVHWSVERHGKRPLEHFAEHGGVGPHTLNHHCTLVTDSEIELLADSGSAVSYNPLASVWKGDRVAPALAFVNRGVQFGLGTDSTRMDAFRLLDCAETCQRVTQGMQLADFSCGAAWTWVDAATIGSADAAGLGSITGSLEAGKRADFLILDLCQPEVVPSWDFEWELVRLFNRDQIEVVVIDGVPVMANGKAVGWDQDKFVAESRCAAKNAVENAPTKLVHPVSSVRRPAPAVFRYHRR
jgi:5-methylthioadenosine/S-adenosylhomocysteine deaminase